MSKNLMDVTMFALNIIQGESAMNPECCGSEMIEKESKFTNSLNEYQIIGYECLICGRVVDTQGEDLL